MVELAKTKKKSRKNCKESYYQFRINERLIGLNEYITLINRNRHAGNKRKQGIERMIGKCIRDQLGSIRINYPVFIKYTWIEDNRRRDKDNVSFAKKFIQDAMVKEGLLENDGWREITDFKDSFIVDKGRAGVVVELFKDDIKEDIGQWKKI